VLSKSEKLFIPSFFLVKNYNTKMKKLTIIVFLACGSLVFYECKKSSTVAPEPVGHSNTSGSFELLQKRLLNNSCAIAGCHSSEIDNSYKQHKLILKGVDVYKNLFNGSVANPKAIVAGLKQIVPKDLAKSFFYQKINFSSSLHKYGNAMPLGADALTAKQIKFIGDWILAGAPEKGHVADEELLLH
jgi:hypothetical protein